MSISFSNWKAESNEKKCYFYLIKKNASKTAILHYFSVDFNSILQPISMHFDSFHFDLYSLSMYKYRRVRGLIYRVTSRENMSSEVYDQVILKQVCYSEALLSVCMHRLNCAFVVRICHKTGFLMTKNTTSQSTSQKLVNTQVYSMNWRNKIEIMHNRFIATSHYY